MFLLRLATMLRGGAAFVPVPTTGQVAWYDPSDLDTMFQTTYGKTGVASAGDPVALLLDKSQGLSLGPELLTNGGFDSNLSGWSFGADSWVWDASGRAYLDGNDTPQSMSYNEVMEVGKVYRLEFDIEISGGSFGPQVNVGGFQVLDPLSESGHYVYHIVADSDRVSFKRHTGAVQVYLDNVSLKEVPGNHLVQGTAAAQPTYQTDGTLHWLEFDGVDDRLVSADFPAFSGDLTMGIAAQLTYSGNVVGLLSLHEDGSAFRVIQMWDTNNYLRMGDRRDVDGISSYSNHTPAVYDEDFYASVRLSGSGGAVSHYSSGSVFENVHGGFTPATYTGPFKIFLGDFRESGNVMQGRIYGAVIYADDLGVGGQSEVDTYLAGLTSLSIPSEPTYSNLMTYGGGSLTYNGQVLTYGEN